MASLFAMASRAAFESAFIAYDGDFVRCFPIQFTAMSMPWSSA